MNQEVIEYEKNYSGIDMGYQADGAYHVDLSGKVQMGEKKPGPEIELLNRLKEGKITMKYLFKVRIWYVILPYCYLFG